MFSLGGLSECGKTSAGLYLDSIGVKRMKIIHIERDMMEERGYDLSDGMKDNHIKDLYAVDQEGAFREFLYRLLSKLQAEDIKFASIESLYRAELGEFLKRELGSRMINIYIESPIEVRAARELEKVNKVLQEKNQPLQTLEKMMEQTANKDIFKLEHGADRVKDIANIIINNNLCISKEEFHSMVHGIAAILLK